MINPTLTTKVYVVGDEQLLNTMRRLKGFFRSTGLRRLLTDTKNVIVSGARQLVPRRSRLLHRNIVGALEGFGSENVAVRVGTAVHYGAHVELGTKPHVILPKGRKALYWVKYDSPENRPSLKGAAAVFQFAAMVRHPGTKPQPYLFPTFEKVKPRFLLALKNLIGKELAGGQAR